MLNSLKYQLRTRLLNAQIVGGVTQQLQENVGVALLPMMPKRSQEIAGHQFSFTLTESYSWIDKCLRAGLARTALKEKGESGLVEYHNKLWLGEQGKVYHETQRHQFEEVFLKHFLFVADQLEEWLSHHPEFDTVCEIGTGSGQLLDYLSRRFPQLNHLIGIDLTAETIAENAKKYSDPRMEFVSADAKVWVADQARPNTIYISFRGVLEYFPQQELEQFFASIPHPALFIAIEPVARDHDLAHQADSIQFRGDYTFSHNYPYLFAKAGYKVLSNHHKVIYYHREHAIFAALGVN